MTDEALAILQEGLTQLSEMLTKQSDATPAERRTVLRVRALVSALRSAPRRPYSMRNAIEGRGA